MFKGLFGRRKEVVSEPVEHTESFEQVFDDTVFVTKRLDAGMPVEILGEDSTILCSGRITDENNLRLVINRLPGELSLAVLPKDSTVILNAYNSDAEHVRITATVVDSTITRLVLRGWNLEDNRSKREAKRFPLDIEANFFSMRDTSMTRPRVCRVKDLSESGARITTIHDLVVGDTIRLQLEVLPNDGRMSMPSQVVWANPVDNDELECGLVFAEMEKYKVRYLRDSLKALKEQIVKNTKK